MRKLALLLAFAVLIPAAAFAHNGALSLYMDQTISDCDAPIGAFETVVIKMYYVKDQGYDLGNAVEFKLGLSTTAAIFTPPPTWNTLFTVTLGDIDNGISLAAGGCLGVGFNVVYIGDISVLNFGEFGPFTCKVLAHPTSEPPGIYITRCDAYQTRTEVLGGTFIFNGVCNPGVETESWGAIKALYR